MASTTRESRGGRLVAVTLLGLVVVLGVAYVGLAWYVAGKVPHATSVQGVQIGGLTDTAAEQRLRSGLTDGRDRPVELTWRGRVFRIDPRAAGLRVDAPSTVALAGGGFSLEPGRVWRYFAGGGDIAPVVAVDEARMRATLARLDAAVDRQPVEGAIRFVRGEARAVRPQPGLRLDEGATRELMVHELVHGGRMRLPVVPDEPSVDAAAVATAMRDFARPAMSAPVVLVVGGESIIAPPAAYSQALSMVPEGHRLRPVVDGERLLEAIRPAMTTVGEKPRDARIEVVGGRPHVVPARIGATFDLGDLARRFPIYAARPSGRRQMKVKAVVQKPRFSTADALALGVDHVVGEATSRFTDPGSGGALRTSAHELTGELVRPHGLLSVPAAQGAGTAELAASQVASTLYSAAFVAGLQVVDRTPLTSYHAQFALGVDARVDATHPLRLRNDTRYGLVPVVSVQDAGPHHPGSVTVRLWSTQAWDVTTRTGSRRDVVPAPVVHQRGPGCRPSTGVDGFTVTVTRVLRRHGRSEVVAREPFTSRYRPTATVDCPSPHGHRAR